MSDRVLRPRVRNGPTSLSFSEGKEKIRTNSSSRRRNQKEVMQNLLNTVAQERFDLKYQQSFKKRVVFSNKRYTSDDLANGLVPGSPALTADVTPVSILKHSPGATPPSAPRPDLLEDLSDAESEDMYSTPKAARPADRNGPRVGRQRVSKSAGRPSRSRVSKHASFTEALRTSPWTSASESILAALSLSTSPLFRKRAKEAEKVAREDETVRRAIQFYKDSGEWWNIFPKTDYAYSKLSPYHREISPGVMTVPNMSRRSLHSLKLTHEQTTEPTLFSTQNDDFVSDSDEVEESISEFASIKRPLAQQQER